jgi:hypothetical protein
MHIPLDPFPAGTGADGSNTPAKFIGEGPEQFATFDVADDAEDALPPQPAIVGAGSMSAKEIAFDISWSEATRAESRALVRATVSEERTVADKMPIIAITTRSSMRVNPRIFIYVVYAEVYRGSATPPLFEGLPLVGPAL